ncbi:MAG: DNA repair protein [Planktomarina sp.]
MSKKNIEQNPALIWLHWVGIVYVALMASCLVAATGAAMLELMPWFDILIPTTRGAIQMGPTIQILSTGMIMVLVMYLPSSLRVLKLEAAHRDFNLTMDDVTKAYAASHEADRAGVFNLSSEFDSVRERINHMRQHPELSKLEPAILDVASQMSHVSRDLADVYSDEAVDRAKTVLRQRQLELEEFSDQLALARRQTDEVKRWVQQLEVEGSVSENQLGQLKQDLAEILPAVGLKVIRGPKQPIKPAIEADTAVQTEMTQLEDHSQNIVTMSDDKKSKAKVKIFRDKESRAAE